MSKFSRTVSQVAGILSIVLIPFNPGLAAAAGVVSAVAGAVSVATQKPPKAQGAVNQVVIGANMPVPYSVGRTYVGGFQVYDDSGGVDNKIRFQIAVTSAAGPIEGYENLLIDYSPVTALGAVGGYYSNFMWVDNRLGTRPDSGAYTDTTFMPGWDSSRKLSGFASYKLAMKFDKDAKRFTGGAPQTGMVGKYVKLYDPRKDSTFPGGSGTQRWDDEATWVYGVAGGGGVAPGENPALQALSYARGRYIEKDADGDPLDSPVKLLGLGLRARPEALDVAAFVEAANLCDINGWTGGGTVYEGPGLSKWDNLKRLCAAFGAMPLWTGGVLTLKLSAPRPALFTLTADDLADGGVDLVAMRPRRERHNSIVPKFRSEPHRWEYVQGGAVTVPTYLAEDGELRSDEVQFDLVQDKDQAAQLAAYEAVNRREFGPIRVVAKPRMLLFRPGEAGIAHIPEAGLSNQAVIITGREVDPATGKVTLTLESETPEKHAYALARTGTAPETPTIRLPGELDDIIGDNGPLIQAIASSFPVTVTDPLIAVAEDGTVTITDHIRRYTDGHSDVAVDGDVIATGLAAGTFRAIGYDDPLREGGAVTYQLFADGFDAVVSPANPGRHYLGFIIVPTAGSGPSDGTGGAGPGGACVTLDTPVLMAAEDGGAGVEKPAGEIAVGDRLWTRHEATLKWGSYPVQAVAHVADQALFSAEIAGRELVGTAGHLVHVGGNWAPLEQLGSATGGSGTVVRLTVTGAATYVSNGILSHNLKPVPE